MPFAPGMPMTVASADPPHALVLWQATSGGKAIDPTGPLGDDHVAWSWGFVLEPVDAATTRLLIRMRVSYQPAAKWAPYMWLLVEPGPSRHGPPPTARSSTARRSHQRCSLIEEQRSCAQARLPRAPQMFWSLCRAF
jgi:hypothetical protein